MFLAILDMFEENYPISHIQPCHIVASS